MGDRLIKRTEVSINNKLIVVEDCYVFRQQGHVDDGPEKHKERQLIFKREHPELKKTLKRNTKNVMKNFTQAFIAYLKAK